jgi:hypothetical protein
MEEVELTAVKLARQLLYHKVNEIEHTVKIPAFWRYGAVWNDTTASHGRRQNMHPYRRT